MIDPGLIGKTALITGGAVRVGKAITLALAQAGANVVINYFSSADQAEETCAEASTFGVGALAVVPRRDRGHDLGVKASVSAVSLPVSGI